MTDDDKKTDERGKKAAAQQLTPNAEGNVMVDVIMGPYRGNMLRMTEADGQAAINAHWARDPNDPYGEHDPLTDQQRTDAFAAAQTWAQAQWDTAQGAKTDKDQKRAMKPEEAEGYKTRQVTPEPPRHPEPPKR